MCIDRCHAAEGELIFEGNLSKYNADWSEFNFRAVVIFENEFIRR
jgi:hypothetical protein